MFVVEEAQAVNNEALEKCWLRRRPYQSAYYGQGCS